MEKIKLEFESPKVLNALKQAKESEKKVWKYAGIQDSTLELDTTNWLITCAESGKSAKIDEWQVDESNYVMKLKSDNVEGDFTDLDYTFSVAMLGQMVSPTFLVNYLKQLQDVYDMKSEEAPEKNDTTEEDNKGDNLPKQDGTDENN